MRISHLLNFEPKFVFLCRTKVARVDSESRAAIVEKDVTLMCGELDWNKMAAQLVTMLLVKISRVGRW